MFGTSWCETCALLAALTLGHLWLLAGSQVGAFVHLTFCPGLSPKVLLETELQTIDKAVTALSVSPACLISPHTLLCSLPVR